MAKRAFFDAWFPPADAMLHEAIGWEIAKGLWAGDYSLFFDSIRPGNPAYRAWLGMLYAMTAAPEVVVYTLNAALAFSGLISLLELLSVHTRALKAPFFAVYACVLLPSGLLWTTTNLKEGAVLWGGCQLLYWTLQRRPRGFGVPLLGLFVLAMLRPHIAVMWLVAIGATAVVKSGRVSLGIASVAGVAAGVLGMQIAAPGLFESVVHEGLTESLQARQEGVESDHGGRMLSSSDRILVYTGVTLIALRPWPTEVGNPQEMLAGAEVWTLALIGMAYWRSPRHFVKEVRTVNVLMAMFIALLCFGFYFSFMYNMGLAVRQRLMVFPAVLLLYFWPAFSTSARAVALPAPMTLGGRQRAAARLRPIRPAVATSP